MIVIRTDNRNNIGMGHTHRSMNFGLTAQEMSEIIYIFDTDVKINIDGEKVILDRFKSLELAYEFIQGLLRNKSIHACIVDHYEVDTYEIEALSNLAPCYLLSDSYGTGDARLTGRIFYDSFYFDNEYRSHKLSSAKYYILKRSLIHQKEENKKSACMTSPNILINFGGSTVGMNNRTALIDKIKCIFEQLDINPKYHILGYTQDDIEDAEIFPPSIENIGEFYKKFDIIVTAGGTSALEINYLKIPMLTFSMADNQIMTCELLSEKANVPYIGDIDGAMNKRHIDLSIEAIYCNVQIVDEYGASRILGTILSGDVWIREVNQSDVMSIYKINNSEASRKWSMSSKSIDLDTHIAWFEKKLSEGCFFIICHNIQDQVVGTLRIDKSNKDKYSKISIAVSPGFTGQGYGYKMLRLSVMKYQRMFPADTLVAEIHSDNIASIKIFKKCGFILRDNDTGQGYSSFYLFPLA